MADDPTKKRPQDGTKVNINQQNEVQYWAQKFGVTPERLREAVAKVGNAPDAVEREIKRIA